MHLRRAFLPIALVLASCRGPSMSSGVVAITDEPRACTKDPAAIQDYLDNIDPPPHCYFDSDCPCGMNCNPDAFCDASCIDATWCSNGQSCDNWGQCVDPGGDPPPPELPVLSVDPPTAALAVPASGAWPTTEIHVTLTASDAAAQQSPEIAVSGSSALPPGCSDSDPATPCPSEGPSELEVACSAGGAFAAQCKLSGQWAFTGSGPYTATRSVYVRPKAGALESTWYLRLFGEQVAGGPQLVALSRVDPTPKPFAGHYSGALELVGDTNALPMRVPVTAYANNGAVVVDDAAHLLSPTGRLRLAAGPAIETSWLQTGTTLAVAVEVLVSSLAQDPSAGTIDAAFTVRLPAWPSSHVATPPPPLAWHVALTRDGALPTACTSDAGCATGSSCDPVLGACLPGAKFAAANVPAPVDAVHVAALDSPSPDPALGTASTDVAERLLCYTPGGVPAQMELAAPLLQVSAEPSCPTTAQGTAELAVRLPVLRDSKAPDEQRTESALFQGCLEDLAASPTDVTGRNCISLGRTYPALALLAAGSLGTDRRAGLLLEHDVRDWLTVHAFIAGQARLQSAIGAATPVDPAPILDRIANGISLLVDPRIGGALTGLPPAELAAPDHRGADQPIAYWVTGDADLMGHTPLVADGATSKATIADGPLARDLTATFTATVDVFKSTLGTAIDSPWLSIGFVAQPIGTFYEIGSMRSFGPSPFVEPNASALKTTTPTWAGCMQWAMTENFLVWSWDPPTQRCWIYAELGDRRAPNEQGDGASASVMTGYVAFARSGGGYESPPLGNYAATFEDNYDRYGSDLTWFQANQYWTFDASYCQRQCLATQGCLGWSYAKTALPVCYIKGGTKVPVPLRSPNTGVTSGLSPLGAFSEALVKQHLYDGVQFGGIDIATVANVRWDGCADACRANTGCQGWALDKTAHVCHLRAGIGGSTPNASYASGWRGGIDLAIAHRAATGEPIETRTHLTDDQHLADDQVNQGHLVEANTGFSVVRRLANSSYTIYRRGAAPLTAAYSQQPFWAQPATLRLSRSTGVPVGDVALFDTPLDTIELNAIEARRSAATSAPVLRGANPAPIAVNGGDQAIGLPVTIAETVEADQALMTSYVDSNVGAVVAECLTNQTPTRDALLARAGDLLRRDALAVALADEMHERATLVGCRADAECTAYGSGAHCGVPHAETSVMGIAMAMTGTLRTCNINGVSGVCSFEGSGSKLSGPPGPGTATATFSVPHAGTYRVWARVVAPGSGSDSFWGQLDGGAWQDWEVGGDAEIGAAWRLVVPSASLAAGAHTIAVSVREDGALLAQLKITDDPTTVPPGTRDDVCVDAQAAPIHVATPWDDRYTTARSAADATRANLVQSLASASACRNPLGIEANDLPLYFRDPVGASNRYFASSDYLLDLATTANDRASSLYEIAKSAWTAQVEDVFQRDMTQLEDERRVEQTASVYEQQLGDLCGTVMANPGDLLGALSNGALPASSCFVQSTAACQANYQGAIRSADASCYRGAIGEAVIAMQGAALRSDGARQAWNAKQVEYEKQSDLCVFAQGTQDIVNAHYAHLDQLRRKKAQWDEISLAIGVLGGIAVSIVSVDSASTVVDAVTGEGADLARAKAGDHNAQAGLWNTAVNGLLSLFGGNLQAQIDAENATYQAEVAKRSAQQEVMECWARADALRDATDAARIEIQRAESDVQAAALHFANLRRRTDELVAAGTAAVVREQGRTVERPQFDFWLADDLQQFQHELGWAKRLTYMAMLAVAHDFQTTVSLHHQILDARTPSELGLALESLKTTWSTGMVDGSRPQQKFVLLSLGDDILGLTGTAAEKKLKLREILRDHAQRITDASGNVVGAGIAFTISPELVPALQDRCGERIWSTLAALEIDPAPIDRPHVRLLQNNTFSSQSCTSGMQTATVRPTRNLFSPTTSMESFVTAPTSTIADMDMSLNTSTSDLERDGYAEGAVTDLAGHGLYGDYVLVFPSNETALDLDLIVDVYLRFDYLSVAH